LLLVISSLCARVGAIPVAQRLCTHIRAGLHWISCCPRVATSVRSQTEYQGVRLHLGCLWDGIQPQRDPNGDSRSARRHDAMPTTLTIRAARPGEVEAILAINRQGTPSVALLAPAEAHAVLAGGASYAAGRSAEIRSSATKQAIPTTARSSPGFLRMGSASAPAIRLQSKRTPAAVAPSCFAPGDSFALFGSRRYHGPQHPHCWLGRAPTTPAIRASCSGAHSARGVRIASHVRALRPWHSLPQHQSRGCLRSAGPACLGPACA
jgi:hypothetical protein